MPARLAEAKRDETATSVSGRTERAPERRVGRLRKPAVSGTSARGVAGAVGRKELQEGRAEGAVGWARACGANPAS